MADEDIGSGDRTEEATPERREDFRERGQVVMSKELTSVAVLAACVIAYTAWAPAFLKSLQHLMVANFEAIATRRVDAQNVLTLLGDAWTSLLQLTLPIFGVTLVASTAATLLQTRLNWSWEKLKPDFSRLGLFSGLTRMINLQALLELGKSFAKLLAVGAVAFLILHSEWAKVPELMGYPLRSAWVYWGGITKSLFWAVAGFLVIISLVDYLWNFLTLERQLKMTKQEVKEDYKKREVDPHVKARMRRMARDMATRKTLAKTRTATVLVTNPTHFSLALRYEAGDRAPVLVAKGVDFLALRMREVAKEEKIPIIENRPLARELYATVEEGAEIPDKLYKAVAEIIRYVFRLKGRRIPAAKKASTAKPPPTPSMP